MTFLVGHENNLALLKQTVREGRPAHAYLFTGPEGIGKQRVGLKFACLLNCPGAHDDLEVSCPVCRRIIAEKHPDVTIERPEKGIIRIDRIRNLQAFFKYAPVEGRYRVTIIDDAHLMNRSAQNALLKTLEEPPAGRILILVTARPSLLLPTVRSRSRRMRFNPIPVSSVAEVLEQKGIPLEKARALAAMSSGSVSRAMEMDASSFLDLRERVVSALADPMGKTIGGLLELSAKISTDKHTAVQAIEIASTWIRDLVLERAGFNLTGRVHGDILDRIASAAQHHNSRQLLSVYDELVKASSLIEADINVNRNLVTDVMLLRIARILAGPSLGVVMAG
ncbi:MAG: DNA polymerase III subunit delta' [Desulfomonilaceae bacterium]